jgi:formylglycine-generating enzyme required for sulfatase activity
MRSPLAVFKFVARAALNAVGFGMAGDIAVDVVPDMAKDVYHWWVKDKPKEELQEEVQAAAELPPEEAAKIAKEAVAAEAADKPPEVQQLLTKYLELIPLSIRQSLRRPEDPSGKTVSANFSLKTPSDVIPLLPARVPRFKAGDRPSGIGDWVLDELLGMGGFGEVWRAKNPYVPDPVALKFCLDPSAAQWLRHEAALLGRVISQGRHPGIVALLDTYLSGDPPCLKYEYVSGGDLCSIMTRMRDMPSEQRVPEAIHIIHQLAGIVAFAHGLKPPIVHRDLKPANILIQPAADGTPMFRIADFGIGGVASNVAREATQRGTTQGFFLNTALRGSCTPLYASPQQMRGQEPDPRDDVHALGVIWYQMLTGDMTNGASSDWRDEVDALGLPEDALRLLGACLSSRAERRPANAAELANSLVPLLADATVAPAPPPPPPVQVVRPKPAPVTPRQVQPSPRPPVKPASGPRPVPTALPRFVTNSLGMKFVLIPSGTFQMGSPDTEVGRSPDEGPQHAATITRPFYFGVYPVTQEQFQRVMNTNPSHFGRTGRGSKQVKGEDPKLLPVERVPWGSAVQFCRKLSELREEQALGRQYRLPTEAEWERACRGGKAPEPFHLGASLSAAQANFDGREPYGEAEVEPSPGHPTGVGSYPPNDYGLYDLHGNVWEWCSDWYAADYYANSPAQDPQGPETGTERVLRGGCWSSVGHECRAAARGHSEPGNIVYRFGLRVVLALPEI